MICPECGGSGRVRKRFLIFFTRSVRCRKCLGSGEFPPPVAHRNRYMRLVRDEDRDQWASTGAAMGAIASRLEDSLQRDAAGNDAFEVGSGGRSGGGGGGASWGDAADGNAPVIVDPFDARSAAVGGAIAAAALASADAASSSADPSSAQGDTRPGEVEAASGDSGASSSDAGASSTDGGTSY
jgi:hypothetical protein